MNYDLREKNNLFGLIKIITDRKELGGTSELIREIWIGGIAVVGCNDNRQIISAIKIAQSLP